MSEFIPCPVSTVLMVTVALLLCSTCAVCQAGNIEHTLRRRRLADFGLGSVTSWGEQYFTRIRQRYGVTNQPFTASSFWDISVRAAAAKSGSGFYKSRCKKFFMKEMIPHDLEALQRAGCMERLTSLLCSNQPHLTLPLYQVFISADGGTSWMVMPNATPKITQPSISVDMKGSIGIKDYIGGDDLPEGRLNPFTNLGKYWDNNVRAVFEWIEFADPVRADATFNAAKTTLGVLLANKWIDYSLCFKLELGWHHQPEQLFRGQAPLRLRGVAKLRGMQQLQRVTVHIMAILDYTTNHDACNAGVVSKGMISWAKGLLWSERSTVMPQQYYDRSLANWELMFRNVSCLRGSVQTYEGMHNQKYSKECEYVIKHLRVLKDYSWTTDHADYHVSQAPGVAWYNLMVSKGAKPQPMESTWQPGGPSMQPGVSHGDTNRNQLILVVIGLAMMMIIACCIFGYLLLKKKPRKNKRKKPEPVRKKIKHPKRRRRDHDDINSESSEW